MSPEAPCRRRVGASGLRSRLALPGVVLALWLAGCSPTEDMRAELDDIPLPADLVLLDEQRGGPDVCFAGDCPWVDREYASGRGVEDVCRDLQAAIAAWGVTEAQWHISSSERNPCYASARRGDYWVSVSVLEFSRFERLYAQRASRAPAGSRASAVSLGLRGR